MKISFKDKEINLPDFMIVGAAKSGTTSLYYYLGNKKEVYFPVVKEPHFFSFYGSKPKFQSPEKLSTLVSSLEDYNDLFSGSKDGQILGDASPSYLFNYKDTINNIKYLYGDKASKVKIIIILRNPIDRAWSQYWHFRKNFNENDEFLETIKQDVINERMNANWNIFYNYIEFGFYYEQVKAYLNNFENVKIFLYDDLKESSNHLMKESYKFLGLKTVKNETSQNRQFNPSGKPKKNLYGYLWTLNSKYNIGKGIKTILPMKIRKMISNAVLEKALDRVYMDSNTRDLLYDIYEEDIKKLDILIGRNVSKLWR